MVMVRKSAVFNALCTLQSRVYIQRIVQSYRPSVVHLYDCGYETPKLSPRPTGSSLAALRACKRAARPTGKPPLLAARLSCAGARLSPVARRSSSLVARLSRSIFPSSQRPSSTLSAAAHFWPSFPCAPSCGRTHTARQSRAATRPSGAPRAAFAPSRGWPKAEMQQCRIAQMQKCRNRFY